MAQRFTDSNKWLDNWFSNLSNDYKIVWLYLLDICDNAGIFQINLRLLNFNCGTNLTEKELLETFNGRITKFDTDKCIINKFCIFQYGTDFLNSKNKAVLSAIKKLIINGLLNVDDNGIYTPVIVFDNTIDTLSIPYQMSIDTPKDKEQVKDKDKIQEEYKEKSREEYDEQFKEDMEYMDYVAEKEKWYSEDKSIEATEIDKDSKELLNKFDNLFRDIN